MGSSCALIRRKLTVATPSITPPPAPHLPLLHSSSSRHTALHPKLPRLPCPEFLSKLGVCVNNSCSPGPSFPFCKAPAGTREQEGKALSVEYSCRHFHCRCPLVVLPLSLPPPSPRPPSNKYATKAEGRPLVLSRFRDEGLSPSLPLFLSLSVSC